VSNEGQHGGVEKKTPIDQSLTKADGGQKREILKRVSHHAHITDYLMQTRCQGKETPH